MVERPAITLFGSSAPRPGDADYERAFAIGGALAEAGFDLVNGGHEGTMEASARGAAERGARVLGVTCRVVRTGRGATVNRHVHALIDAPDLFTRIEIMLRRASGYVVLPGGTGTLAELGLAWEHLNKGFLAGRPLVCVGPFWQPVIDAVEAGQPGAERTIRWAQGADEVIEHLRAALGEIPEEDRTFTAGEEIQDVDARR